MSLKLLTVILSLLSTACFAGVNFSEKKLRVDSLMKLQNAAPTIEFAAYQRELNYESKNLSIDQRTQNETTLLAQQIQNQILIAYKAALAQNQNVELTKEEIKNNIAHDLELAHPDLKEELMLFSNNVVDSLDAGGSSQNINLNKTQTFLKSEVIKRNNFLNNNSLIIQPAQNDLNHEADQKEYKNKKELIDALVSNDQSTRWVSSSNQTMKTEDILQTDAKISLQVKIQFLGAELSAGPTITFQRLYKTSATIMSEGLSPVLMNDGNFDYWKRDLDGKIVKTDGKEVKRFIAFYCQADLQFQTQDTGGGGFTMLGLGGQVSLSKRYINTVTLASRRINMPESVDGKSVTLQSISELCNNDFLNAKFNKSLSVKTSLNTMMKNLVAGLTYSHPKNTCAVDNQCANWFNKKLTLVKNHNTPRCVEENSVEKFRTCQLRGLEGQNCPVYENKQLVSSGQYEYPCDVGLKCTKTENQSSVMGFLWNYAKGTCQIVDKRNYSAPDLTN